MKAISKTLAQVAFSPSHGVPLLCMEVITLAWKHKEVLRPKYDPNEMNVCSPWHFIGAETMIDCSAGLSKSVACFWTAGRRPISLAFRPTLPRELLLQVCTILFMWWIIIKETVSLSIWLMERLTWKHAELWVYAVPTSGVWTWWIGEGGSMFGICILGPRVFFSSCLYWSQLTSIL